MEWLWLVVFLALLLLPVALLARLRRPPAGPDSYVASETQVGLDQIRTNSRRRP